MQKICQSSKNIVLVLFLLFAMSLIVIAHRCESYRIELAEGALTSKPPIAEEDGGLCASRASPVPNPSVFEARPAVIQLVTPRHLLYFGAALVLAWCCCPCFKLE